MNPTIRRPYLLRWPLVMVATAALPAALAVASTTPQDTAAYRRSMTIERDFAPIIQQAAKIDRLPAVDEPAPVQPAPVSYAAWQARQMTTTQTGSLPVGQVIAQPDPATHGWMDAYCGSYLNTRVEAGLRLGGFTLDGSFRFTRGDLPLGHDAYKVPAASGSTATMAAPDYEWQAQHAAAGLRAGYEHTFHNDARIRLHAGAKGSKYNLFDWALVQSAPSTAPAAGHSLAWQQMATMPTQRVGTLFADADFDIRRWHFALDYRRTGVDQPASRHEDVASGTLRLNATFWKRKSATHMRSGDILLGASHGDYQGLTAKYVLHASHLPSSGALRRFYVDAGFGFDHASLDELMERHPFALIPRKDDDLHESWDFGDDHHTKNDMEIWPQFDILDGRIGYENNEQGYLKWNIYAKAKISPLALGYYAHFADGVGGAYSALPAIYRSYTHGTRTILDVMSDAMIGLGANIDYEYSRHFGLTLAADFEHHTEPLTYTDRPKLSLDAHMLIRPTRRLTLDLSFFGGFLREGHYSAEPATNPYRDPGMLEFSIPRPDIIDIDLDPILDLGLRADYRISPRLALYAFGRDLLNRKADRCTLVPAQGIALHGGLSWRF